MLFSKLYFRKNVGQFDEPKPKQFAETDNQTCDEMHYEHVRKQFKDKAQGFIQSVKKKEKYAYLGKLTDYIDYCDNMNDFFIQMHENLPKESPSRQNSNMNYIKKQTTIADDQRGSSFGVNFKKLPTPKTEAHQKLLVGENGTIMEKT